MSTILCLLMSTISKQRQTNDKQPQQPAQGTMDCRAASRALGALGALGKCQWGLENAEDKLGVLVPPKLFCFCFTFYLLYPFLVLRLLVLVFGGHKIIRIKDDQR